jgi:hypothetical protein
MMPLRHSCISAIVLGLLPGIIGVRPSILYYNKRIDSGFLIPSLAGNGS